VVLYHNIVVAHGGQRDVDDCIIFGLRVLQRLPVMETTLVEVDQVGVLSVDQSPSLNHTVQACFSKPGDSWLPRENLWSWSGGGAPRLAETAITNIVLGNSAMIAGVVVRRTGIAT
jgi:hypothetical protein